MPDFLLGFLPLKQLVLLGHIVSGVLARDVFTYRGDEYVELCPDDIKDGLGIGKAELRKSLFVLSSLNLVDVRKVSGVDCLYGINWDEMGAASSILDGLPSSYKKEVYGVCVNGDNITPVSETVFDGTELRSVIASQNDAKSPRSCSVNLGPSGSLISFSDALLGIESEPSEPAQNAKNLPENDGVSRLARACTRNSEEKSGENGNENLGSAGDNDANGEENNVEGEKNIKKGKERLGKDRDNINIYNKYIKNINNDNNNVDNVIIENNVEDNVKDRSIFNFSPCKDMLSKEEIDSKISRLSSLLYKKDNLGEEDSNKENNNLSLPSTNKSPSKVEIVEINNPSKKDMEIICQDDFLVGGKQDAFEKNEADSDAEPEIPSPPENDNPTDGQNESQPAETEWQREMRRRTKQAIDWFASRKDVYEPMDKVEVQRILEDEEGETFNEDAERFIRNSFARMQYDPEDDEANYMPVYEAYRCLLGEWNDCKEEDPDFSLTEQDVKDMFDFGQAEIDGEPFVHITTSSVRDVKRRKQPPVEMMTTSSLRRRAGDEQASEDMMHFRECLEETAKRDLESLTESELAFYLLSQLFPAGESHKYIRLVELDRQFDKWKKEYGVSKEALKVYVKHASHCKGDMRKVCPALFSVEAVNMLNKKAGEESKVMELFRERRVILDENGYPIPRDNP